MGSSCSLGVARFCSSTDREDKEQALLIHIGLGRFGCKEAQEPGSRGLFVPSVARRKLGRVLQRRLCNVKPNVDGMLQVLPRLPRKNSCFSAGKGHKPTRPMDMATARGQGIGRLARLHIGWHFNQESRREDSNAITSFVISGVRWCGGSAPSLPYCYPCGDGGRGSVQLSTLPWRTAIPAFISFISSL